MSATMSMRGDHCDAVGVSTTRQLFIVKTSLRLLRTARTPASERSVIREMLLVAAVLVSPDECNKVGRSFSLLTAAAAYC